MIDIVIGSIQPVGPTDRQPETGSTVVEAEILNIRPPRQSISGRSGEERRKQFRQDPHNGQVLTILVPNNAELPKDLDIRKYKVKMRFIKK